MIAADDALAGHILRLLNDVDLQQQLSVNGRQLIEVQYTWGRVADMYEALYEDVISVVIGRER